jgi:hypothetical protein
MYVVTSYKRSPYFTRPNERTFQVTNANQSIAKPLSLIDPLSNQA